MRLALTHFWHLLFTPLPPAVEIYFRSFLSYRRVMFKVSEFSAIELLLLLKNGKKAKVVNEHWSVIDPWNVSAHVMAKNTASSVKEYMKNAEKDHFQFACMKTKRHFRVKVFIFSRVIIFEIYLRKVQIKASNLCVRTSPPFVSAQLNSHWIKIRLSEMKCVSIQFLPRNKLCIYSLRYWSITHARILSTDLPITNLTRYTISVSRQKIVSFSQSPLTIVPQSDEK